MRRSRLFLAIMVLLLVFGIVGSAVAQTATQVTLRFSWWGGDARHNATLEAIKLYQELNPNVVIKPEYGGADGYLDKIKVQLASKTAPDVMQIDQTWIQELISKGDFFVDLNTIYAINTAPFDPAFLKNFCVYGDKLLGLPTGMNAQVLIINKTAADKMGVDISKLGNWDTLLAEGVKLHKKDKAAFLLHHDTGSFSGEVLAGMLQQMTGKMTFDAKGNQNYSVKDLTTMFTWLSNAVKGGVIEAPGDAAVYNMKGEQNPKWINGQIIGLVDWTSNYARYMMKDTEYVFVLPPNVANAKSGASNMRPAQEICLNASSPNIAEGAKFLNWFLNSPEAAKILGDVRSIPVSSIARKAAAEAGKINEKVSSGIGLATKSIKLAESGLAVNREIVQILIDVAAKVEFGKLTPAAAAAEMIKLTAAKVKEINAAAAAAAK